jgi:DNA-binding PadR family transcriptional regulator
METASLLCLLQDEMHGYELVERIEEMVGSYVCVDPGSTYRLLRDLENGGHLTSAWQPAESGPLRRTYRVTASGRELLAQWAAFLEKRARVMDNLANQARELLAAEAGPTE